MKPIHHIFVRIKVTPKQKNLILAAQIMCVEIFSSYELLKNHLDFAKHEYEKINATQLGTVTEKWLKQYVEGNEKGKPREIANVEQMEYVRENRGSDQSSLGMGWAIPIRNCGRLNDRHPTKLSDDGERTGNKLPAEEVFQEMQNKFSSSYQLVLSNLILAGGHHNLELVRSL